MGVNIFQRQITRLRRVTLTPDEQNGNNIILQSIGSFIDPRLQYRYATTIAKIRQLCPDIESKQANKEQVAALKLRLPAAIVSGIADGSSEGAMKERNGVICIDIDGSDNPAVYDWQAVKAVISQSKFVAYCGLSVTGLGVFLLVPVDDPNNHEGHFDALKDDLEHTKFVLHQAGEQEPTILHGLKVDAAPRNICAKRFVSYDAEPYINADAEVYTKVKEQPKLFIPKIPRRAASGGPFDVEGFLQQHGIAYNVRERHGGLQYEIQCPWHDQHTTKGGRRSTAVFVYPDGTAGFNCKHGHCEGKRWPDFRAYYDRQYQERQQHGASGTIKLPDFSWATVATPSMQEPTPLQPPSGAWQEKNGNPDALPFEPLNEPCPF